MTILKSNDFWKPNTRYYGKIGYQSLVVHNDSLYLCNTTHRSTDTFNNAFFTLIGNVSGGNTIMIDIQNPTSELYTALTTLIVDTIRNELVTIPEGQPIPVLSDVVYELANTVSNNNLITAVDNEGTIYNYITQEITTGRITTYVESVVENYATNIGVGATDSIYANVGQLVTDSITHETLPGGIIDTFVDTKITP